MAALPPLPPIRENNVAGSVVRNAPSGRLARWQPYFANCHSIPNKRALPTLIRLRQLPTSPVRSAAGSDTLPQSTISNNQLSDTPTKSTRERSQLPTPSSSPPGTPPTLLEQTSSNYVLELSLAILASIYFQPGCQQALPNITSPRCDEDSRTHAASPSPPILTPTLKPSALSPVTPTLVRQIMPFQRAPKNVAPLTPQSPPAPKQTNLPPLPSVFQAERPIHVQSLPSKRELARHLSALGVLEPQPGAAPAGSMRWFLSELFKRAALPGLIIRVAAGYVLRCRAAINRAMQSVALKNKLLAIIPGVLLPPADRTPQERVLTDARRVFLAALVLACKFVFDKPYDNRSWSLISGLGSRDIGECERVVGDVLGWRLWIGAGRAPHAQ